MQTEIAIIGGGLSGLAVADLLERAGRDWQLLEARGRLGGRILSEGMQPGAPRYDLGPAWIWPHNPRVLALAERLGARVFPQHAEGRLVFQEGSGQIRRDLDFSTMAGSYRIEGGMAALTDGLAAGLPSERIRLDTPVTEIADAGDHLRIVTPGGALTATQVVLALPPRIAAGIKFSPSLPEAAMLAMRGTPTWMAGQAKAVAVYPTPFWRAQGLSGDGISHRGPVVEIHDASPAEGGQGALFGFIGVPAAARLADPAALSSAIAAQLVEMFGPEAADPQTLLIQDWAGEATTATEADWAPLGHHPRYGVPPALETLMAGRVIFAGSETAPDQGGFVEGALEAAERAAGQLLDAPPKALTANARRVPS